MPKAITNRILECRTPGGLKIQMERWYYEGIRRALLEILPEPGVNAELYELHKRVADALDPVTRESVESLTWLVAWVRLDMEAEGLLKKEAGFVERL